MIGQWVHDFLQFLRFEKRYSPHTISAYAKDLAQFQTFLVETFAIEEVEPVRHFHIRSWLAELHEQKATPRTINRKISAVSSWYKFLLVQGAATANPVRMLHAMKLPQRLPHFLKEKETETLLEEVAFEEGFKGTTDRLICELLYNTGMRRAELLGLKLKDIEWSMGQVRVLGKGSKERLIPVGEDLLNSIKHYQSLKQAEGFGSDTDTLLLTPKGKPLSASYVYSAVKHYLGLATTQSKKSPHVMRHTFATHLLQNGANIQAIKDLLGHSSLAATQVYTHINIEKLKEIHKQAHPKG